MAIAENHQAFVFGPFRLLPSQRLLLRGSDTVRIGGRALDALHFLVRQAGVTVTKSALVQFVWPHVFVDETNLKVHISSIRRALEDSPDDSRYIATVAGRGYQFVGRVAIEDTLLDQQPGEVLAHGRGDIPKSANLIGRLRDIERVRDALRLSSLVTLVGVGGVGKTSLAIAVGHAEKKRFEDDVCFVDLSLTTDASMVLATMATTLGVRSASRDLLMTVRKHLKARQTLLIVDNCEHVSHAASTILAQLLEVAPRLRVLATSREPLGLQSENVLRLAPLSFPSRTSVMSVEEALTYSSIELFAMRASETADFVMNDVDAPSIASLCASLDGLPLAIGIAAAKLKQLRPKELLRSLCVHLQDPGLDCATSLRHRTLWNTLDWSYQLLSPLEAAMFRSLAVFAGSFECSDIRAIASVVRLDTYQLTLVLGGLVAKSLVAIDDDCEHPRYKLLETVRAYASDQLARDPQAVEIHREHARLTLRVLRRSEEERTIVEHRIWLAKYFTRLRDVRSALDWSFGMKGDPLLGVELAVSAIRLWNEQSAIAEQRVQLERALSASLAQAGLRTEASAALAASLAWSMTLTRQSHPETEQAWKRALDLAKRTRDLATYLPVAFGRAVFHIYTGRNKKAVKLLGRFENMAREGHDHASVIDGERLRALAEMHLGCLDDVTTRLETLSEELAKGMPASRITRYREERYVSIHSTLAFTRWLQGHSEHASILTQELLCKTEDVGHSMGQSNILVLVALPIALWEGDLATATRHVEMLQRNLDRERLVIWEPACRFYRAAVERDHGHVSQMLEAVDELINDGFLVRTPMYLGVIADYQLTVKRLDEAAATLGRAFKILSTTQELWCRPELLRIQAKLFRMEGDVARADSTHAAALRHARSMGARSLELRLVHDLSGGRSL